jgi:hypothetical protein
MTTSLERDDTITKGIIFSFLSKKEKLPKDPRNARKEGKKRAFHFAFFIGIATTTHLTTSKSVSSIQQQNDRLVRHFGSGC